MSELSDRLQTDMVTAMKARDAATLSTLRMTIAAIKNEQVRGLEARVLSEVEVVGVLNREVAKRRDSAEAYTAGNRPELAAKELQEVEVLQRYLPTALTDDELDAIVAEEVSAAAASIGGAPTMKQMGLVIKAVNARAAGRAEGAKVAAKGEGSPRLRRGALVTTSPGASSSAAGPATARSSATAGSTARTSRWRR